MAEIRRLGTGGNLRMGVPLGVGEVDMYVCVCVCVCVDD
jgi:hypothetical protein